jgi:UDP-glucuronate decarboxylase
VFPHCVLLSGGTGFFGKALIRFWSGHMGSAYRPQCAIVLTRSPARFLFEHPEFSDLSWIRWVTADLSRPEALDVDLSGVTHILHAATESTFGPSLTHQQQFDQITQGTRTMLALAARAGRPKFLYTSTGGVYGRFPAGTTHVSESYFGMPDPLDPRSAYSVAKRASEHLCALAAHDHGLPVVVCRPFAFCGPDLPLDVHFAIGNFIRDALFADKIAVNGDGSPVRSYLDQEDLAEWLSRLLVDGEPGEAYNVGSDQAISILDLAYRVRDLVAPHKPVQVLKAYDGVTPRQHYVPDVSKITKGLALRQTISLDESILRTANAHRI